MRIFWKKKKTEKNRLSVPPALCYSCYYCLLFQHCRVRF